MKSPRPGSPERMAMDAYPRNKRAQAHWLNGWRIGHGEPGEGLGSYAEECGRRTAAAMLAAEPDA
jgi:hypothetical protein